MFQFAVPSIRIAPGVLVVPPPSCILLLPRPSVWAEVELELSLSVPMVRLAVV